MSEKFHSKNAGVSLPMPPTGSLWLSSNEIDWQDSGSPGFWIKPLMEDPASSSRTWLMRVDPGAYAPPHAHSELEQIYMLEGQFGDDEASYGPGDYVIRAPGAMHSSSSESGALVLLVYTPV